MPGLSRIRVRELLELLELHAGDKYVVLRLRGANDYHGRLRLRRRGDVLELVADPSMFGGADTPFGDEADELDEDPTT